MAADTYYWTGDAADGDYRNTLGNNWVLLSTKAAAAAEAYPGKTDADTIIFPSWAAGAPTTNLDNSGTTGSVVSVTVQPGYAYAIGTVENPLYLKTSGSPVWTFDSADAGDIYLMSGSGTVATVYVNQTGDGDDALHLAFVTAAATAVYVASGNVTFDDTLFYATAAGVVTLTTYSQASRTSPVVTVRAPVTTKLVARAGTVYWEKGTITNTDVQGATVTAERSSTGPTLTNATYYGGKLLLATGGANLTVSNAISVKGDLFNGNFSANIGQSVSFTT